MPDGVGCWMNWMQSWMFVLMGNLQLWGLAFKDGGTVSSAPHGGFVGHTWGDGSGMGLDRISWRNFIMKKFHHGEIST